MTAAAVLAVVALLVIAIASMRARMAPAAKPVATTGSADPIAVDLYERGRALWLQRGEAPNQRAVKLFTEAVSRDAEFAEAWAALASAWLTLPTYSKDVTAERAIDEALLAADRAIELDPTLSEPRSVMAAIAQRRGDWLASERVYRRALEADPENVTLMLWFAGHYRELGMMKATKALTDAARQLEPNSPPVLTEAGMNELQIGRLDVAAETLDYLWFDLGVETPVVWTGRWFSFIERGEHEAAHAWLDQTPFRASLPVLAQYVERRRDQVDAGDEVFVARVMAAFEAGLPGWMAFHLLDQSGFPDAALDVADRDSADGLFDNSVVLFYPRGGSARSTTRFAELVARLGFVDYWQARGGPDLCLEQPGLPLCQLLPKRSDLPAPRR